MGAVYMDGANESLEWSSEFVNVNFTNNHADEWTGALRVDHGAGPMSDCVFHNNTASVCAAFFDFAWKPSKRILSFVLFSHNSAQTRAGGFCAFHIMHLSRFESCIFVKNKCKVHANSIYIESSNAIVELKSCTFDGPRDKEIERRFGDSDFEVDVNCTFGK
jgi:hypothetical protein